MRTDHQERKTSALIRQLQYLVIWLGMVVLFTGLAPDVAAAPLTAAAASESSVTLSWSAPGDDGSSGTATAYSIRYSTSNINSGNWPAATEATGVPAPQVAGSVESFDVTGLNPGTLYYFAIRSVDEAGNWSGMSNVVSLSTDAETDPPAAVADLRIIGTGATSLTVAWTAPGDDGNIGTASLYELRYSTVPINASNFGSALLVSGLPSPQAAGATEAVEVTGLSSSTTYYFALVTADEVPNWSTLSNVASGNTSVETIAPAAIADLAAGNATETTVDLTWTAPGDDGSTGQAAQYVIRYSTVPINASNWASATAVDPQPNPNVAGSSESYTVTGLSSATVYYFAIMTADEVPNWSALSNVASLTTGADQTPPAAIGDLTVASGGQ